MDHWFFFSYARVNKHRFLKRFHADLSTWLNAQLTAAEQERRSFADWESLELASRWIVRLEEALESARVLVCLTSAAYVTQEWCGKEVAFFEQMAGDDAPERILPVIWTKTDMPPALSAYQYTHESLPEEYVNEGLFNLMYTGQWPTYRKCVAALGNAILQRGRKQGPYVPQAFSRVKLASTASAFHHRDKMRAKVVYCSVGTPSWRPFVPPPDRDDTANELVETVIARRQMAHDELLMGAGFADSVKACGDEGNPVLIVVDPLVANAADRLEPMLGLDRDTHKTTALFVPWNDSDPTVRDSRAQLETVLARDVVPRVAFSTPPIQSGQQLQRELNAMLEQFAQLAANQSAEGRTVTDRMVRVSGSGGSSR